MCTARHVIKGLPPALARHAAWQLLLVRHWQKRHMANVRVTFCRWRCCGGFASHFAGHCLLLSVCGAVSCRCAFRGNNLLGRRCCICCVLRDRMLSCSLSCCHDARCATP